MGRPSKRSPEREELVLRTLRAGVTRQAAAEYAEMDARTLRRWMDAKPAFRDAVIQAEAAAEVRFQQIVADDAFGRPAEYDDKDRLIRAEVRPNPASARWWLSRRRRAEYATRVSVDIGALVRRTAAEEGIDEEDVWAELDALGIPH